ncbi:hypothetical protein GE061_003342 [Apolygus lucorum]|uniref:BTB domain-containing protein n=1 Tax=Apolygus lucorum TaxID=248454 RepID=A0A6A4JPF9_APOLU|nr:hypothetical protein GE061_003342 [Apolygus lucorum]
MTEIKRVSNAPDRLQTFEGGEEGEDMSSQHYCLRWNNYQSNMTSVFHHLLRTQSFVDVTLACNDQSLKAHKVVLSACSSYFQKLLLENPCKHPTIIMPQDVCFTDLKFIIEFVYKGEIDVSQAQLQSLLKTADQLKIKGLCEVPEGKSGAEVTPLPCTPPRRGLSVRRRKLASAKRRLLYRERLLHQTSSHHTNSISRRIIMKKEAETNCMDVATGTEEVKEMPLVVVNQNNGISDAMILASPQALPPLQPPIALPPSQLPVPNEVNQSTQVEVEMTGTPAAPSATLVTGMNLQQPDTPTTHRDIAIDSSDLGVEENGVKVKFETLRSIEQVDHMDMDAHMTNGAVQADVEDDPSMHTMMITPELLGLIPSSNSESSDMDHSKSSMNALNALNPNTMSSGGKTWTKEDMEAALEALRKQTMSLSKASAHYGIPSTTLWQRAHRLGIDTPKKDGPAKSWTEDNLNTALDALRQGSISANKASKAFGIPSSTLYKIARREGIRLAAPFNAAPTSWVPEDLERALEAIRSGQFTVQRAATEYGIPSGTLYGRCKREGIELSRNNPTPWSEDAMMEALEAVRIGQMSINQAAIHYNLPYSSLYGRFKRVKYEADGLSGSETDNSEQTTVLQPTQPPAHAHAHSQPQIMLVQYQQPLHMYQSAT